MNWLGLKVEGSRSRSQQGQTFERMLQRTEACTSTHGRGIIACNVFFVSSYNSDVLWFDDQAKRRIEQLEEAILQAQARETQIVEMSQWMTDVNDLLQTRLDADVLASDTPKEFEVIIPLLTTAFCVSFF